MFRNWIDFQCRVWTALYDYTIGVFSSLKWLIDALLWLLWFSHNLTTMMNNVWAIRDMHQVAWTELAATVNWCWYREPLRKRRKKKKSPVLLRGESGTCNEYFISPLIGCQFSIAGLHGPIFNHFCNVRAMCDSRWSLSGRVAPLSLIFSTQTEQARDVYVAQNNTTYIYCNWMTRLAFRTEIKWQKKSAWSFSLNLPLQRVTGWQGGHVPKLRNHKEVKEKKKKNYKPATVATLI